MTCVNHLKKTPNITLTGHFKALHNLISATFSLKCQSYDLFLHHDLDHLAPSHIHSCGLPLFQHIHYSPYTFSVCSNDPRRYVVMENLPLKKSF